MSHLKKVSKSQMSHEVSDFLDVRQHGFFRVAAGTPVTILGQPQACAQEHLDLTMQAYEQYGAQMIVFPELGLSGGYTVQDAHQQTAHHRKIDKAITWFLRETKSVNSILVFGAPVLVQGLLFNGAYVCLRGEILGIVIKEAPPNYAQFTEARWFNRANLLPTNTIRRRGQDIPIGTDLLFCSEDGELIFGGEICEDSWLPITPGTLLALHGAMILFNISASNYQVGKPEWRQHLARRSGDNLTGYVYANCGDGESTTGMSFDGHKLISDRGAIIAESELFLTGSNMIIADIDLAGILNDRRLIMTWNENAAKFRELFPVRRIEFDYYESLGQPSHESEDIYHNLLRGYSGNPLVPNNDRQIWEVFMARVFAFRGRLKYLPGDKRKIVLGLSGGKDSADVLMVALRTIDLYGKELGMTREDIVCLTMPSFGTSDETFDYATALSKASGITLKTIPIAELAQNVFTILGHPNLVEEMEGNEKLKLLFENIQAWLRKILELGTAAEFGFVLGSSSGSEIRIGWFTLFGDGSSHFAPNAAMGKSLVPIELRWLARTVYANEPELGRLLVAISHSASSPELLPTTEDGKASQNSEVLNGPEQVRDFFDYWLMRMRRLPSTIFRLALEVYEDEPEYTPQKLYGWLGRFITRSHTNRFKPNAQSIDGTLVGSAASPSAHDLSKYPSDMSAVTSLDELEEAVPAVLRKLGE